MAFHAAVMMAVFVDQVAQAPVIVQCPQTSVQDPLLARILFAAIPSIFALGIAWVVVHLNSGKEHKQWIRDQKQAEWRATLDLLAAVSNELPDRIDGMPECPNIKQLATDVLLRLRGTVFIHSVLQSGQLIERWSELERFISGTFIPHINKLKMEQVVSTARPDQSDLGAFDRWDKQVRQDETKVQSDFYDVYGKFRGAMRTDLRLEE